ncbi:MAG TPA: hypothetical protein VF519_04215 [Mycobacteriales bacterium]|jgi:hypothetical protein
MSDEFQPSSGAGVGMRLARALGQPGKPRRRALVLIALLAAPFVVILVAVLAS